MKHTPCMVDVKCIATGSEGKVVISLPTKPTPRQLNGVKQEFGYEEICIMCTIYVDRIFVEYARSNSSRKHSKSHHTQ